jgi:transposase
MFAERQNSDSFIEFLEYLLKTYIKMVLVTDGAAWHRSRKTNEFIEDHKDRIQRIFLPTYSPEMNPTEECWKQTRRELTTNTMFNSKEEMEEELSEFFDTHKFNHSLCNYLGL